MADLCEIAQHREHCPNTRTGPPDYYANLSKYIVIGGINNPQTCSLKGAESSSGLIIPYGFCDFGGKYFKDCPRFKAEEERIAKQKYSPANCPNNQRGLTGDDYTDTSTKCVLTGSPDADSRGWGYDSCDFKGEDYTTCSKFKAEEEKKANQKKSLEGKCSCGKDGVMRVDNGLRVGIHCDKCYDTMITDCRKRSW